jgi:hypothetical protein
MLVYLLLLLDSNSHVVDLVPHDAYSMYSMIYIMKRYESHSSHHGNIRRGYASKHRYTFKPVRIARCTPHRYDALLISKICLHKRILR